MGVERVDGAGLGAEEDAAVVDERGGLAGAGQGAPPEDLAGGVGEREDFALVDAGGAGEDGGVDDMADGRGGGGGERADAPLPEGVAGVEVDRAEGAVVGELEDVVAVEGGRELEQRVAVADPEALEGREDAGGGGEEAGVVAGVAVEGPGGAFGAARGQGGGGLGDEAGVGVVDVAGAVALVEVGAEGERERAARRAPPRSSARAWGARGGPRSYDRGYGRQ